MEKGKYKLYSYIDQYAYFLKDDKLVKKFSDGYPEDEFEFSSANEVLDYIEKETNNIRSEYIFFAEKEYELTYGGSGVMITGINGIYFLNIRNYELEFPSKAKISFHDLTNVSISEVEEYFENSLRKERTPKPAIWKKIEKNFKA
jgi:hypothetical protein